MKFIQLFYACFHRIMDTITNELISWRRKTMKFTELDTPVLLIDRDILYANCKRMQDYADEQHL